MGAAANYMDERENTQLYAMENGRLVETDRYEAAAKIEDTETRYQQHLAFTTKRSVSDTLVDERRTAEFIARVIQERRPDAEIYAVAVHSDGKGDENGIHVHAIVGTATTLRREDLTYFREKSHELEQRLDRDNYSELTSTERNWIQQRNEQRETECTTERIPEKTSQRETQIHRGGQGREVEM